MHYLLYTTSLFKNPSFFKGLEIDKLPLLERFGTFKEDIAIENILLNQLVLQY
jgi:hypothetical protein